METATLLSTGSIVLIDAGQAFVIMEKDRGYTIAEATSTGLEAKDVFFSTLVEMENWFNECESKIAKVIPYTEYLIRLHDLAEKIVENVSEVESEPQAYDRSIESLKLSVRTYNCLKRAGVNFESQIRKMSHADITKIRNLSRKGIWEIEQALNIEFR